MWRFLREIAENSYANDSSITHFNEASIANLIRELPQNSFDAKHDGCIDPSFRRMLLMQCAWAASCRRQESDRQQPLDISVSPPLELRLSSKPLRNRATGRVSARTANRTLSFNSQIQLLNWVVRAAKDVIQQSVAQNRFRPNWPSVRYIVWSNFR